MLPISVAIAALMAIVVISYRQTVRAYPSGGGAYIVSKENLGTWAALVAAAALLVDYMMTVVVSIVAGVFAIGSAFPCGQRPQGAPVDRVRRGSSRSRTCAARASPARCSRSRRTGSSPSIFATIAIGMYQCVGGCPATAPVEPIANAATVATGDRALRRAQGVLLGRDRAHRASRRSPTACRRSGARRRRTPRRRWRSWASSRSRCSSGSRGWRSTCTGTVASDVRSIPAQIAYAVFGGGARLLRRAVLHGRDPDPGREHGLPGLPAALVDPGARPVHAEAVREPRRPAGLLQRRRRARDRRPRS